MSGNVIETVMGAVVLVVAALFQVADASQVMALGLLRGVQDTRVPMWMAGVSYWCIGIPASYVLAFPLHMAVMADGGFPFGAVGLVHIENRIVQHRRSGIGEALDLAVRPTARQPHPKGRTFSLATQAPAPARFFLCFLTCPLRRLLPPPFLPPFRPRSPPRLHSRPLPHEVPLRRSRRRHAREPSRRRAPARA